MNEQPQAPYETETTTPTEQVTYRAIGTGVYAFRGDEHPSLICECYTSKWLGVKFKDAHELAEQIARMKNQQAAI